MQLRRFNKEGIEKFRNELKRCRDDLMQRPNISLLDNPSITEIVADVDLRQQIFKTKGEAGIFLRDLFRQIDLKPETLLKDAGLWTWLSLFYFDSVCPKGTKILGDYWFIFDAEGSWRWNCLIHHLFVSWRVMEYAGQYHRLFSNNPVAQGNVFTGQVMKRLSLLRIPCIFEVLEKVYLNPKTGKLFKKISSDEYRGNISNRFPRVIEQLSLTYDLQSVSADTLVELLGDEFKFEA
jgi:hypothetical protein